MTEQNLPAVREPDPVLDRAARVGVWLAASESNSKEPKAIAMAAALRLYYAAELGLPPLAAAELSVIHGRLVVSAQLLRALAQQHGYRVVRIESTDQSCTAALVDSDEKELGRATFTLEDAKRAGLMRERSAWFTHPARMLWARASAFAVKDYAPHVALGLVTVEEAAELEGGVATDSAAGGTASTGAPPSGTGAPDDSYAVEDADWSEVPEALQPEPGADPERIDLSSRLQEAVRRLAELKGNRDLVDQTLALIKANREFESPERHKAWLRRQITAAEAQLEPTASPFQKPEAAP